MSFSVSLNNGRGCEWGTRNGLSSLFAQKRNILNPYFWQMITELIKFKEDALTYIEELECNPDTDRNETLGEFLKSHGYSALFQKAYLVSFGMFFTLFLGRQESLNYVVGTGTSMWFHMAMPTRQRP